MTLVLTMPFDPRTTTEPGWFYDRQDGLTGPEVGCLMTMDQRMDVPFVRDPAGEWYFEGSRRFEGGLFDFGWSTRTLYALRRKGWVEATAFDENMKPMAFKRTAKRGQLWDEVLRGLRTP